MFALPLVYLVLGSLRARGLTPPLGFEVVPEGASLDAYRDVVTLLPVTTLLRNSLLVVGMAVPVTWFVASFAGWGIRILPTRTTRIVVAGIVLTMMIPVSGVWATRFEIFEMLGLTDTLLPVAATALIATNPFFVLVYAWMFERVPDETLDAARVDGATTWQAFWHVALPQAFPATLAVVTLSFALHWGNFIDPLLYLKSSTNFTATQGLRLLQQLNPTDWPLMMAGSVLLTIPPIVVFMAAQRWFLDDVTLGGRS